MKIFEFDFLHRRAKSETALFHIIEIFFFFSFHVKSHCTMWKEFFLTTKNIGKTLEQGECVAKAIASVSMARFFRSNVDLPVRGYCLLASLDKPSTQSVTHAHIYTAGSVLAHLLTRYYLLNYSQVHL